MYVRADKDLGQAPQPSPAGGSLPGTLFQRIRDAVQRGQEALAISLALAAGVRDENTITDFIFWARHPERWGRKLRGDDPLSQQWLDIRSRVRLLLRTSAAGLPAAASRPQAFPTTRAPTPSLSPAIARGAGVDPAVIRRIAEYDVVIESESKAQGVDPSIVKGIIAAESGGNRYTKAPSGYKGLMQAATTDNQFIPEISIRTGIEKFKKFRDEWLGPRLKRLGVDIRSVDKQTMVRWVTTAYNAGHVTVLKAVEYAAAAGNKENWMNPEHYQRALIFSGGYSVKTAAPSCLKGVDGDVLANELSKLTRMNLSVIQSKYLINGKWNNDGLKKALIDAAIKEKNRWAFKGRRCRWWECPDPPHLEEIRKQASQLLMCSVRFKHERTPVYTNKIIRYMQHFDQARSANR